MWRSGLSQWCSCSCSGVTQSWDSAVCSQRSTCSKRHWSWNHPDVSESTKSPWIKKNTLIRWVLCFPSTQKRNSKQSVAAYIIWSVLKDFPFLDSFRLVMVSLTGVITSESTSQQRREGNPNMPACFTRQHLTDANMEGLIPERCRILHDLKSEGTRGERTTNHQL